MSVAAEFSYKICRLSVVSRLMPVFCSSQPHKPDWQLMTSCDWRVLQQGDVAPADPGPSLSIRGSLSVLSIELEPCLCRVPPGPHAADVRLRGKCPDGWPVAKRGGNCCNHGVGCHEQHDVTGRLE